MNQPMNSERDTHIEHDNKHDRYINGARVEQRGPWFHDHFTDLALDATNLYTLNKDAGATNFAVNAQVGGVVRGITGAINGEKVEMARGAVVWKPSKGGLIYEVKINLSAITTIAVVCGLVDAKTYAASTLPFAIAGAAITSTAVEGVAWIFDAAQTTPVWSGLGVKTNVDTAILSGAAPVAATFDRLRIEIDESGHAKFFQNDLLKGQLQNAVLSTALLVPYIGAKNGAAASRNIDVDSLATAQAD